MLPAALAMQRAIVQYNAKHSLAWLVYDVDRSTAAWDWEYRDAPAPNIIAKNPQNGHAHLFYGLIKPVHNYEGASWSALRYMGAIDVALTEKLGADEGYSKLLSKNPINDSWETFTPEDDFYSLDDLAQYLELDKYRDSRRRLPRVGHGRNCDLFDDLRRWAYRQRRQPYLSEEMFHEAVRAQALRINQDFPQPLPHSEVRSTAKSVAKWTWRRMSHEGFLVYQTAMSRRAAEKRREKAAELGERIRETREQCPDIAQADIAAMFGVTQQCVSKHLREYNTPVSDKRASRGSQWGGGAS
jgi:tetratricopeptide (TPR) repeat protein